MLKIQAVMNGTLSHLSAYTVFEENILLLIIPSSYLKYYILIIKIYNFFILHLFFSKIFTDSLNLNVYCFHKPLEMVYPHSPMENVDRVLKVPSIMCLCTFCVCVSMSLSVCKWLEDPD